MPFYFEKLIVWQKAYTLSKNVYELLKSFPKEEQYALSDQIKRAAVSIVSNIAEGSAGRSDAEHKHFLLIAQGSCMELATQIMLANDFGYIENKEKEEILGLIEEVIKMLYAMRNKK